MSLETAFKRLAIRQSSVCHQFRRTISSSAQRHQPPPQQSATSSLVDMIQSPRNQSSATPPSRQQQTPPSNNNFQMMLDTVQTATKQSRTEQNRTALAELRRGYTRKDLEGQVTRRYKVGDVYAPHDLTGAEAAKWKKQSKKPRPRFDVLDQLGIDPRKHYTNFSMMGEYMSELGKIKSGRDTGLRPVNQRRMAKAIRRAVGVGLLMPGTHKHPELLKLDREMASSQR